MSFCFVRRAYCVTPRRARQFNVPASNIILQNKKNKQYIYTLFSFRLCFTDAAVRLSLWYNLTYNIGKKYICMYMYILYRYVFKDSYCTKYRHIVCVMIIYGQICIPYAIVWTKLNIFTTLYFYHLCYTAITIETREQLDFTLAVYSFVVFY